jgi:hypothetical protein
MFLLMRRDADGQLQVYGTSRASTKEEALAEILGAVIGDPSWIVEIVEGTNTYSRWRVAATATFT